MSIFDITPAGAYMNAITAANEKDRQNARRIQNQPVTAPRDASRPTRTLMARVVGQVIEAVIARRPAANPHAKAL